MDCSAEYSKAIIAILGVIVGAFIAPWVESKKRKADRKEKLEACYIELGDLRIGAEEDLHILFNAYKKCILAKRDLIKESEYENYKFPQHIQFLLLDKYFVDILPLITREQRIALKALVNIIKEFNAGIDDIANNCTISIKNQDDKIFRSAIFSICSFYYLVDKLIVEKEKYKNPNKEHMDLINEVLERHQINLDVRSVMGRQL